MCAEQLTAVDLLAAAVVFDWDGTAVADRHRSARQVRRRIESLCERGIHVAVVSGAQVANIDRQFGARPSGPGRLLLALNRGSELYDVSACGPRLLLRRDETSAVGRQLDEAADRVVAELGAHGLEVALIANRVNRRTVDLIPETAWSDPPKARIGELLDAVTARLQAHGLDSLGEVVATTRRIALDCGLADPRVSSDAKHVELGVTDKSDSMTQVLETLGRRPGPVRLPGGGRQCQPRPARCGGGLRTPPAGALLGLRPRQPAGSGALSRGLQPAGLGGGCPLRARPRPVATRSGRARPAVRPGPSGTVVAVRAQRCPLSPSRAQDRRRRDRLEPDGRGPRR